MPNFGDSSSIAASSKSLLQGLEEGCFGIGDVASNVDVGASKQVSPSEALPDSALQQIKLLQGFNGEKLHRRLFGNGREDLAGGRKGRLGALFHRAKRDGLEGARGRAS